MPRPPDPIRVHPLAEIPPEPTPEERSIILESIRKGGQIDPIELLPTGEIIDGRTRYAICMELSIKPRFRTVNPSMPLEDYVEAKAIARRHLTASQRAMIVAKIERSRCLPNIASENGHNNETDPNVSLHLETYVRDTLTPETPRSTGRSVADRAAAAHVGETIMRKADRVAEASPEAAQAVIDGDMSMDEAAAELVAEEAAESEGMVDCWGTHIPEELREVFTGDWLKDLSEAQSLASRLCTAVDKLKSSPLFAFRAIECVMRNAASVRSSLRPKETTPFCVCMVCGGDAAIPAMQRECGICEYKNNGRMKSKGWLTKYEYDTRVSADYRKPKRGAAK